MNFLRASTVSAARRGAEIRRCFFAGVISKNNSAKVAIPGCCVVSQSNYAPNQFRLPNLAVFLWLHEFEK
jgi:hypothetical protein